MKKRWMDGWIARPEKFQLTRVWLMRRASKCLIQTTAVKTLGKNSSLYFLLRRLGIWDRDKLTLDSAATAIHAWASECSDEGGWSTKGLCVSIRNFNVEVLFLLFRHLANVSFSVHATCGGRSLTVRQLNTLHKPLCDTTQKMATCLLNIFLLLSRSERS